ncbi:anthranilate synthase component II [Desulfogranum mediterraneum]|uniref:anthranilate synthase component II n=1 Tax=Desulfogranum mediterraneum TaxID=160661 RepID=UPI00041CD8FD|nr:aminodeoxychorismate/anthranilate synthase component II [Desulfogranum mediterraneum]
MIVLIDNYDSFTYNIVQMLATPLPDAPASWQPPAMKIFRNDKVRLAEIQALNPERLLISPGPKTPDQAGISMEAIEAFSGRIPILGVCLGHQSIAQVFGGKVIRAKRLMHGKTSPVHHDNRGIFTGLSNPFEGMRYHSLIVEESSLPECFEASAHTDQGELMGLRHRELPIEGVQFHPESIMTREGMQLLHTFLRPDYEQLLR